MLRRIAILFLLVAFLFASEWEVALMVDVPVEYYILGLLHFGVHPDATDGFDARIDLIQPPCPPDYNCFFFPVDDGVVNRLNDDYRGVIYSGEIIWEMHSQNHDSGIGIVSWDPDDLPPYGSFHVGTSYPTLDIEWGVNMRYIDSLTFEPAEVVYFRYSVNNGIQDWQYAAFNITIDDYSSYDMLEFGINEDATDGFDRGIDRLAPPAAPGGTHIFFAGPELDLWVDYRGR